MLDPDIGQRDFAAKPSDSRHDLLMHPPLEPQRGPIAKHPHLLDDCRLCPSAFAGPLLHTAHDERRAAPRPASAANSRNCGPFAASTSHLNRSKKPTPLAHDATTHSAPQRNHRTREMKHPRAKLLGDSRRLVHRTRIDHHQLIHPRPHARQTSSQLGGRIPHDHAKGEIEHSIHNEQRPAIQVLRTNGVCHNPIRGLAAPLLEPCAVWSAAPWQLPANTQHSRPRRLARSYLVRLFHPLPSSGLCRDPAHLCSVLLHYTSSHDIVTTSHPPRLRVTNSLRSNADKTATDMATATP